MNVTLDMTGVVRGQTIVLDENYGLPEGYRVKLQLILTREEAFELAAGSWSDMTPEDVADFEQLMSELGGEPYRLPEDDPE
jgi:hypothetical protein